MHPEKPQPETRDKPQIDIAKDFFLKFRGVVLTNSEGTKIDLTIRQEQPRFYNKQSSIPKADKSPWIIEFTNYLPKTYYAFDNPYQNFIELSSDTLNRTIKIEDARLEDKNLKGKNIFPQILKQLCIHFPKNFKLIATITHPDTKNQILGAVNSNSNKPSITKQVAESNLIKKTLSAGFNYISLHIAKNAERTIYTSAEKRPEQEGVVIEIN